jgi:hypothetical protein
MTCESDPALIVVVSEDKHSCYFHGAEPVLRAAVRKVACPYMFDARTRRLSVPKRFGDEVAVAVENCGGRIKDRGLF